MVTHQAHEAVLNCIVQSHGVLGVATAVLSLQASSVPGPFKSDFHLRMYFTCSHLSYETSVNISFKKLFIIIDQFSRH